MFKMQVCNYRFMSPFVFILCALKEFSVFVTLIDDKLIYRNAAKCSYFVIEFQVHRNKCGTHTNLDGVIVKIN